MLNDLLVIALLVVILLILLQRQASFATQGTLISPATNPNGIALLQTDDQKRAFTEITQNLSSLLTSNISGFSTTETLSYSVTVKGFNNCPAFNRITDRKSLGGTNPLRVTNASTLYFIRNYVTSWVNNSRTYFNLGTDATTQANPTALLRAIFVRGENLFDTQVNTIITNTVKGSSITMSICDGTAPTRIEQFIAQNIMWYVLTGIMP